MPIFAPLAYLRLGNTGGRYIEPFSGGAAVAMWLGWPRTTIGDTCRPLMEAYEAARTNPDAVIAALDGYRARGIDELAYYAIRRDRPAARVDLAGWFFYLNKTAFNGLWRENRKGGFNVPWGKYEKPAFVAAERLRAYAERARDWDLRCEDFEPVIDDAGAADLIYCDPPYLGTKGGFTAYVQASWCEADQARLVAAVTRAVERGATLVCSDGGSDENRTVYSAVPGFHVLPVAAYHCIGATGGRRGRRREWLATNRPELLRSEGAR